MTSEPQKPTNDVYRVGWDATFRRTRLISKCLECHHEWQGGSDLCDWCGAPGKVIGNAYPGEG